MGSPQWGFAGLYRVFGGVPSRRGTIRSVLSDMTCSVAAVRSLGSGWSNWRTPSKSDSVPIRIVELRPAKTVGSLSPLYSVGASTYRPPALTGARADEDAARLR